MKLKTFYFVYILECADNSYYTGYTRDVSRRLKQHQQGKGSKYVCSRRPFRLIYQEKYTTQRRAMQREIEIQKWPRSKKIMLIKGKKK